MNALRYLEDVATLVLDSDKCIGCSLCACVCPHHVFEMQAARAVVVDLDGCMECGACVNNCPSGAIEVHPGVG